MKNLAHTTSFQSLANNAPPKRGVKHLAPGAKWQALVPHNHARREDAALAEYAE